MDLNLNQEKLVQMGFDEVSVRHALEQCSNNLPNTLEYLLNENDETTTGRSAADPYTNSLLSPSRSNSTSTRTSGRSCSTIVHSVVSQYTVPGGKSACTCIALAAASKLLMDYCYAATDTRLNIITEVLTPDALSAIVYQGVEMYQQVLTHYSSSNSHSTTTEHLSPDEVLQLQTNNKNPVIPHNVTIVGGVKSCILSSTSFLSFLEDCLQEPSIIVRQHQQYISVILVKPPETLLVMLPIPPKAQNDTGTGLPLVLVDSHPRPPLCEGSYAKFFHTLKDLADGLEEIFPVLDLGPDVEEMMNIMYNSVDAYLLQLKK